MEEISQKLIGKRVKAARERAGLTQEKLGYLTGYSAMGISHFEKGTRKIKIEDLEKISKALPVNINYFLEPLTGATTSSLSQPGAIYRRGAEELTEEQRRAEEGALREFEDFVRSLEDEK